MDVYLVGGAVRDKLLGYPFNENDWVVVGAQPKELLDKGFLQVGSDFPVFLHPQSKEEYALARTERKSGVGYKGFECHAGIHVTLEEDLSRRDLTINAIAEDGDGNLIDPYGGKKDLSEKILRHVSGAFTEDPLRVLRVARFAARYHHLGFKIAGETLLLMKSISDSGELEHLTPERVWVETKRALEEQSPRIYIEVLRQCNALAKLFPEIERLFGESYANSNRNIGIQTLSSLDNVVALDSDAATRFAVLVGSIGQGAALASKAAIVPEKNSEIDELCDRLKVPNRYRAISKAVVKYRPLCHSFRSLKPSSIVEILKGVGAFREPSNLKQFIICCEADDKSLQQANGSSYEAGIWLIKVFNKLKSIDNKELIAKGFTGLELGREIDRLREIIIAELTEK